MGSMNKFYLVVENNDLMTLIRLYLKQPIIQDTLK